MEQTFKGAIMVSTTDHFPIFYITKIQNNKPEKSKTYLKRKITPKGIDKFKNKLEAECWEDIKTETNAQIGYSRFNKKLCKYFEETFPVKKYETTYQNAKPWLTMGILSSVRRKNTLYRSYLKRPSKDKLSIYKKYKNKSNLSLNISRKKSLL